MTDDHYQNLIVYEQPLSERMRTFLRLDFLFSRINYLDQCNDHPWTSRFIVQTIGDIINVISHVDIKQELIKELKRNAHTLEALAQNPNVNSQRLTEVQQSIKQMSDTLCSHEASVGSRLRNIELLDSVRKRAVTPANDCDFDLPGYCYWLRSSVDQRSRALQRWVAELDVLRQSVELVLQLVRGSAVVTAETAIKGFFQRNLSNKPTWCQMVRVQLPADAQWFPEISGGKHRLTVRFMIPGSEDSRPLQSNQDIAFKLFCCRI